MNLLHSIDCGTCCDRSHLSCDGNTGLSEYNNSHSVLLSSSKATDNQWYVNVRQLRNQT